MKNFKHLTQNQLLAYADDSLPPTESHEIGKHLLQCVTCRKLLPLPTVEQFWTALMTEPEMNDNRSAVKSGLYSSISAYLTSFEGRPVNLVWSGSMLLVLITFSMMIWMNISSFNTVIVHLDDEVIKKVDLPMPVQTPAAKTSSGTANSNQLVVSSIPKPVKQDLAKRVSIENNVSQMPERNNLKKRAQFSPTRGVSANCNEEKSIELEFSPDKENFVFKWKKVSNATKYHLYISDDDEILIDEYETEKETTFVLKKSLNPLKTYKWKIIVTLENGQMVIGSSNKFTIKDFHTNQIKPEKKGKSDVRCSANG